MKRRYRWSRFDVLLIALAAVISAGTVGWCAFAIGSRSEPVESSDTADTVETETDFVGESESESEPESVDDGFFETDEGWVTETETEPETEAPESSLPSGEGELFYDYYARAEEILSSLTLEEKVGQMFLARFPSEGVLDEITELSPGGYILFARDFEAETPESVREKLGQCQDASRIGLIFGVDEEGGSVVRVSAFTAFRESRFLSPQRIWAEGQLPAILEDSTEKSALLLGLGLNMNLAPVADVPTREDSFMFDRSYGRGVDKTSIYVARVVQRMRQDGMISVMKHFPGYGDNPDTHFEAVVDERDYEEFKKADFLPFISGIEAGGPCVLVSHTVVKCMDGDSPASLSAKVHGILRSELGFSGVIMTDDLAMGAMDGYDNAAVMAVLAGNDIVISSDFRRQKEEVVAAVRRGEIEESVIDLAVRRVLALKLRYGVTE